jgi:hypothetical protein
MPDASFPSIPVHLKSRPRNLPAPIIPFTTTSPTMTQTVVIIGGSLGGLHVAHALLKKKRKDIKVIIVTKVCKFIWQYFPTDIR